MKQLTIKKNCIINKVKKFRLLDRTIPLSLHGSINQVWTVTVLLTLFHFPIMSAGKQEVLYSYLIFENKGNDGLLTATITFDN